MLTKMDKLFGILDKDLTREEINHLLESYEDSDRIIYWSLNFICSNDFQTMPRRGKVNMLAALMDQVTPEGQERLKSMGV